ncbi:MAG: substrate-binding domain-containing protein, partial [Chloroflexota bacterium]
IKIPEGMAVVGFDDLEWAELLSPPITTVAQDPLYIGHKAVELLLKRLQGESGCEEVRVPVALRIRS